MALARFGADLLAERLQVALGAAIRNDPLESRERSAHARHLRLSLVAAADDAERRRVLAREVLRRDRARGTRAQPPEPVGLDDGHELGPLRGEEREKTNAAPSAIPT